MIKHPEYLLSKGQSLGKHNSYFAQTLLCDLKMRHSQRKKQHGVIQLISDIIGHFQRSLLFLNGGGGGGAGAWNASVFCCCCCCCFIHFFSTSLSLAGNSSRLTWVKHSRRSVCNIFLCPDNGVAAIVLDFLTCAQMLMHAIAHWDRTDTVRESALEIDSGREKTKQKNLPLRGVEPASVLCLAFQSDVLSAELSPPRLPCLPELNDEVVKIILDIKY